MNGQFSLKNLRGAKHLNTLIPKVYPTRYVHMDLVC